MSSSANNELRIKYVDPAFLKPRDRNPRTHSAKQVAQIAASIRKFGFLVPVLTNKAGEIFLGHGRVMAAMKEGMKEIPTIVVDHLSAAEIRALVIADNKICENAGWDKDLLALELKELEIEFNFDIALTGFETPEIDMLLGELEEKNDEADEIDIVPAIDRSTPAISRLGDVWQIGNHRLLCGDALLADSYKKVLGSEKAQMVFTDPPWNIPIAGHVSGKGKIQHPDFAMASGEMSATQFTSFLNTCFNLLVQHSIDGSIHFACIGWTAMRQILDASKPYAELKNLCVWAKSNAGMGSFYRSQHELFFVFKNGRAPHINNIQLGRHGRNRSNVWHHAGANAFGAERDQDLARHPTAKPVDLVADAILDCSHRGGIILDPFAGSGSTLIAAEKTFRRGFGIELDPYFVDAIIRRFADTCGIAAKLAPTGQAFDEIAVARHAEADSHDV